MDPALEIAGKTHLDERQTVCASYVEFLRLAAIVPTCLRVMWFVQVPQARITNHIFCSVCMWFLTCMNVLLRKCWVAPAGHTNITNTDVGADAAEPSKEGEDTGQNSRGGSAPERSSEVCQL
jgi:hypothetical protein